MHVCMDFVGSVHCPYHYELIITGGLMVNDESNRLVNIVVYLLLFVCIGHICDKLVGIDRNSKYSYSFDFDAEVGNILILTLK